MNKKHLPNTCEESIRIGDCYICKLKVVPCEVARGKQCAKIEMEKFIESMTKFSKEIGEKDE